VIKNENFNYDLFYKIYDLKQFESDNIMDVVVHIFEIFHKIYYAKNKKHVYLIDKSIKFTNEVDPSQYLVLKFAIGSVQNITVELPLIRNGDNIMINGNMYTPILQMMDKPLIIKQKAKSAVFMSNLGNIYSTPIIEGNLIRVSLSINTKFNPPMLIWILGFLGLEGFEKQTGVKVIIDSKDYGLPLVEYFVQQKIKFDTKKLKSEYKDPKFEILLNQLPYIAKEISKSNIADKLIGITAKDLVGKNRRGWQAFLSAYDGNRLLTKIAVHQTLIPMIDIFSAEFMKYDNVVAEMLRAFSTEIQPLDLKDLTMKRFRSYEMLLLTLLKHLYNLGMNCMYSKLNTVSKEKRLRIYDNALGRNLVNYDGVKNNSIMRLVERTKLTQTGDGGYTSEMFIGAARDLHESQYGTICPINTPDREKCGVTLYLACSKLSKFDDMYYWPKNGEHKPNRLPLKTIKDFEEFQKKEEIRLSKERDAKAADDAKKEAERDAKLKKAKIQV